MIMIGIAGAVGNDMVGGSRCACSVNMAWCWAPAWAG